MTKKTKELHKILEYYIELSHRVTGENHQELMKMIKEIKIKLKQN